MKAQRAAMRLGLALAVVATLGAVPASGEVVPGRTVQDLYLACKNDAGPGELFCMGYLAGIADLLWAQGSVWMKGDSKFKTRMEKAAKICSNSYSPGSLKQLFINWAEKNPAKWQEDQSLGAVRAFLETWPCE